MGHICSMYGHSVIIRAHTTVFAWGYGNSNRVVPAPDGTIYLVDINGTYPLLGINLGYMYWCQKHSSE